MAEITPERKNIFEEEVDFKSGISERTWFKIGAAINLLNNRQDQIHQFDANGIYSLGVGLGGIDGIFPVRFPMEITGLSLFNRVSGSSGTTEFDLEWYDDPGSNQGSIFSTTPKLDFNSPNFAYQIWDEINATAIKNVTGGTQPVFSKTTFAAGDALAFKLLSAMSGGEDAQLMIHFRAV